MNILPPILSPTTKNEVFGKQTITQFDSATVSRANADSALNVTSNTIAANKNSGGLSPRTQNVQNQIMQLQFKHEILAQENIKIKKDFPALRLNDSTEEDEFDPNELKLLPVLATDRNARKDKGNEM